MRDKGTRDQGSKLVYSLAYSINNNLFSNATSDEIYTNNTIMYIVNPQ